MIKRCAPGPRAKVCPWCHTGSRGCEHCQCPGFDGCSHLPGQQCARNRYKRRVVCNPCERRKLAQRKREKQGLAAAASTSAQARSIAAGARVGGGGYTATVPSHITAGPHGARAESLDMALDPMAMNTRSKKKENPDCVEWDKGSGKWVKNSTTRVTDQELDEADFIVKKVEMDSDQGMFYVSSFAPGCSAQNVTEILCWNNYDAQLFLPGDPSGPPNKPAFINVLGKVGLTEIICDSCAKSWIYTWGNTSGQGQHECACKLAPS